jgi:hypothetical protein
MLILFSSLVFCIEKTGSIQRSLVWKLHFFSYIICFVKDFYYGNVDIKRWETFLHNVYNVLSPYQRSRCSAYLNIERAHFLTFMYACKYVCMYVYMYVCMYTCMHACIHVCMWVLCVCVCMYMYACMYVYACVCACKYVRVYKIRICVYVYVYVYLYRFMHPWMYHLLVWIRTVFKILPILHHDFHLY